MKKIMLYAGIVFLFFIKGGLVAHNLPYVQISFDVDIVPWGLHVYFVTGVNPLYAAKIAREIDVDPEDEFFSDKEKEAWVKKIKGYVKIYLDGAGTDYVVDRWKVPAYQPFLAAQNRDDLILTRISLVEPLEKGRHRMQLEFHNKRGFRQDCDHSITCHKDITIAHVTGLQKNVMGFDFEIMGDPSSGGVVNPGDMVRYSERPQEEDLFITGWAKRKIANLLNGEISTTALMIALFISMLYGALHALSPGHGKTMVAAYMAGSRGKNSDALLLGIIVTVTHTGSVIVLGLILLFLQQYFLPDRIILYITLISGILIILLGCRLLYDRSKVFWKKGASGPPHHHHHNDSEHGHTHVHEHHHGRSARGHHHIEDVLARGTKQGLSFWELLVLGVSGGMVPCPSALFVLLTAVALNRLVFGILLLVSFSFGLAAVLVAIGIMIVSARNFLTRYTGLNVFMKYLSVISVLGIILIGSVITLSAVGNI